MTANSSRARSLLNDYGKVILVVIFVFVILISLLLVVFSLPHALRVSVMDVGQGDAILIVTPSGKRMLIDGGPNNKVLEDLSHELPFFARTIDVVLATHGDADHITGLIPALEHFDAGTVILSASGTSGLFDDFYRHVEDEHAPVYVARQGDSIDFHDGVVAYILSPDEQASRSKDTNGTSISALVVYGSHSFLFTGDLPSKKEYLLLEDKELPKHVTVFKAGHHGSKTSSGAPLLSYIRPEYAVISAGKNNRYGHPNQETLDRLTTYSKDILSTVDRGTISFFSDGRILQLKTEK